jgi:hypothetical protein
MRTTAAGGWLRGAAREGETPCRPPAGGALLGRAATCLLALLLWLALPSMAAAQDESAGFVPAEKKYILEWLLAGSGAAAVIFLIIRPANRADAPKEELELILREPHQ